MEELDGKPGVARHYPKFEHDVWIGGVRVIIFPAGAYRARLKFKSSIINLNLNDSLKVVGINTDRLRTQRVDKDTFNFVPKGTDVYMEADNHLPSCVLEVTDDTLASWLQQAELPSDAGSTYIDFVGDKVASDIGRAAISLFMQGGAIDRPADRLAVESFTLGLGARLISHLSDPDQNTDENSVSWKKMADSRRISQSIDWMETNLGDPLLRVSDMANAANLSACHFATLFKTVTGLSPYCFVLRRRAEFARQLITGTTQPLSLIAYKSGFSSQSHMTTTIKRFYGTTPGMMRG
ncbi:MAG: AraC family transcriptional regulator [Pseudomonadota bacterium]